MVYAEACLASGLFAEAGSALSAALQAVRDTGEHTWEAVLYLLYAELAWRAPNCAPALGPPESAPLAPISAPLAPIEATQRALEAARRMGAKAFESRAGAGLTHLQAGARLLGEA